MPDRIIRTVHGPTGGLLVIVGAYLLLVLANFSSSPATVEPAALPDLTDASVLLATHPEADGLSLAPWESRIYQLS